jgi:hypothetical protein
MELGLGRGTKSLNGILLFNGNDVLLKATYNQTLWVIRINYKFLSHGLMYTVYKPLDAWWLRLASVFYLEDEIHPITSSQCSCTWHF